MKSKKDFFLEAYNLGIIKFGRFTLKSGIESPFYVDLRPLSSEPKILKALADYLLDMLPLDNFDVICGVPYAALPMATAMSLESYLPLIIKRKEAKEYGTKKMLEGIYRNGQNCILVEDVITSGKSLLETISEVEAEGLKVSDIVVVLDREQGGREILMKKGYRVHTLFTITEVVDMLAEEGKLSAAEVTEVKDFVAGNQPKTEKDTSRRTYEQKLALCGHSVGKRLLEIAIEKKSNLIASADVITTRELLDFAEKVGPHIVALKTHIDIITDFDADETILPLKDIAAKHNFLLMEDRKFADIGSTQELQFSYGMYKISNWADLVTSHVIAGSQSLDCFLNVGVVGILSMSSTGTLTDANYVKKALSIIESHPNMIGCVAQNAVPQDLLLFTPGVSLEGTGDGKGQQYNSPDKVFGDYATDFMIVGRGIYKAEDIEMAAITYRTAGWRAYQNSLNA